MNHRIILKLLSTIVLTVALAFLISLGLGWAIFDEPESVLSAWGICAGFALLVASVLGAIGWNADTTFFRKEALATIGLGWLLASLIGALPYLFILGAPFPDAFFESTSGLTTTGSSVFAEIESFPRSLLFFRCMSQWIGGLGVVVFFVAILAFLGAGGKILYSNEASAQAADLNTARVQDGVTKIVQLYLVLSLACVIIYKLCGLGWFDAVCHMFTSVSTGGFGTRAESLGAFDNSCLEWWAMLFMILCGTSFPLLLQLVRGNWRVVLRNAETRVYLALMIAVSVIIAIILYATGGGPGGGDTIRASCFQVVSIMTTTGYATEDYTIWAPATRIFLLMIMIIGGCAGSTSGGIKVGRLVAAWKICVLDIECAFRSHVVRTLRLNGRTLHDDDRAEIMTFIVMIGFVALAGMALVAVIEPQLSVPGLVSSVLASLLNIGPGLAEVGPAETFSFFGGTTKLLLSLLMIMGRLELYAILALLSPLMWRRFE
ncbi:MAG: TrkH family potassium uptake protein [Opitutales bacterium]